jgi:hypothetical protein
MPCADAKLVVNTKAAEIHTTAAAIPTKDLTISRIAISPQKRPLGLWDLA